MKPTIEKRIVGFPEDVRRAILKIEKGANSARNAMFHGTPYSKLCYEPFQNNFENSLGYLGHPGYRENSDITPEQTERWAYWVRYCEQAHIAPDSCFEDWMA